MVKRWIIAFVALMSMGVLCADLAPATARTAAKSARSSAQDVSLGTLIASFGDARDGDLVVGAGQTVTIDTTRVNVTALGNAAAPVNSNGFAVNDLVLFHQTLRTASVGRWEFNRITEIRGPTSWVLERPLTYYYDNTNGTAQVIKVPQYGNVTVAGGGALTAPAWDSRTGGILIFLANGTVTMAGSASMSSRGFKGGYGNDSPLPAFCGLLRHGQQGESFTGAGGCNQGSNSGGGGGGNIGGGDPHWGSGGGAGYGGPGSSGVGPYPGAGGTVYGTADLTRIHSGAGGGGGSWGTNPYGGGRLTIEGNDFSGQGGGIIIVRAHTIVSISAAVSGNAGGNSANPGFGGYAGGGGAGGSILLVAQTLQSFNLSAPGGAGGVGRHGNGGNGGPGRIRIETCGPPPNPNLTNPPASVAQLQCDTTPPTVAFTNQIASHVRYGATVHAEWAGQDEPGGSGLRDYTLQQIVGNGRISDLLRDTSATAHDVIMQVGCRPVTLSLTARDNAGNISVASTVLVNVGLQGDFDDNGSVDADDLAATEAAWGTRTGERGYASDLDINADGQIDAADTLWMRRHLGDRCPS